MANIENTPENSISNNTDNDSNNQSSSNRDVYFQNHTHKKKSMFSWKIGVVLILGVIAYFYTLIEFEDNTVSEVPIAQEIIPDARLQSCNKVSSGEPTEDFNICLSAAKDGEILAIKRIIWGYSRSSEFQNWTEVFTWLKSMPYKDENTKLLMYAIVHFMAKSNDLKKEGETGINRLVAKNYPPANVLLASIYALGENVLPPTSNIQWLLERTSNEDSNALTPTQLLHFYSNSYVGKDNTEKAKLYVKEAAQRNFPVNTNNIAWFLATIDNNQITEKDYALSLAKQVTSIPAYANNPIYLDTLAASYAASGMFELAVEKQTLALELLNTSTLNQRQKDRNKKDFDKRLGLYKSGKSYVDKTITVDKKSFFTQLKSRTVDFLFRKFFVIADAPTRLTEDSDIDSAASASEKETK